MPLDPFVTVMLERTRGLPAISDGSPDDARALIAAGREGIGTGPEMAETRDFALPTRSGSIPARLHVPEGEVKGLLVYLHGGGWVIGNIDDFDTLGRALAARSSCAVLLPDYRLAPESPFPGPVEDCEDAVLWALEAAGEEFGGAPVAVAGDSAGGNLATVVARRLLGQGPIVFQGLVYPVTDHDFSRPSYAAHAEGFPLLGRDMPWFFDHYLQGADPKQPDVSPLHADLTGLPPALVITAVSSPLAAARSSLYMSITFVTSVMRPPSASAERAFLVLSHAPDSVHRLVTPATFSVREIEDFDFLRVLYTDICTMAFLSF